MDKYSNEVQERWGENPAYTEYSEKTKRYSKAKWDKANDGMMSIFAEFSTLKASGAKPNSKQAQALVVKLQKHITDNYYTCTDDILKGLGQMYVADERFKKNIDKYGDGIAQFASEAIERYCKKQILKG